jgi:O-antigen/teichoic acid export membrane protein
MLKKHASLSIDILVLIIERILQAVLSIACVGFMAHSLSINDNGKFAYAYSLSTVLITLSYFAGSELITSKLSKYKFIQKNIITTGFYLRVMFGIICLLISIIFAFIYITDNDVRLTFLLCIIGPLIGESIYILGCWFTANRLNFWFSLTRTIGLFGRFFTVLYLSKLAWVKIYHFAYAYAVEAILISSATILIYFKHPASPKWGKINKLMFKSLFKDGILIGIGLVLYYLFLRFDRILLEKLVNYDTLGLYTTIIQLNDAWLNIGIMICGILGPYFIFNCRNDKIAENRLYKIMLFMLIISIFICTIMPFISPFLINNILGKKYNHGIPLLNLGCWLSLFVFINQIFNLWWLRQKAYKFQISVWIVGIVSMYAISSSMVAKYNLDGMLYCIFIAYSLMLIFQFIYLYYKKLK